MADYNFKKTVKIPFEQVRDWSASVYEKIGMSREDAFIVANIQATADLRGVYSHGIQRCETYVWRIQNKTIDPTGKPCIESDAGAFVIVDGAHAMGQVSAYYGMGLAIERAKKYGSSTVTIKHGNHMGTMAYFSMMAAERDMIGICFTQGAGNNIAPTGGTEPLLGNNPISYAVPAATCPPVVVDMALTNVAYGKISMAATLGNPIPDTWALDKDGKPTTDPSSAYTLQPIAGYKGYGMSFVTTLMTAVLCGSPWGREQRDLLDKNDVHANEPLDITYTMQVINYGALIDNDAFKKRVDDAIHHVKSCSHSDGIKEILVPGEPEARTMARQLKEGISYPIELIEKANALSKEIGVSEIL